jgi:hypothetical protein
MMNDTPRKNVGTSGGHLSFLYDVTTPAEVTVRAAASHLKKREVPLTERSDARG